MSSLCGPLNLGVLTGIRVVLSPGWGCWDVFSQEERGGPVGGAMEGASRVGLGGQRRYC